MIYPEFLKDNATIGICAPSAGVGHKIESFEKSLNVLRQQGWRVWETEHVRVDSLRGGTAKERAAELMSLFVQSHVDAVFAAAGGDFLSEMLPYIDWQILAENPKWLMGASDPTGILYPLTTMCDIATLYGSNGGSFDSVVKQSEDSHLTSAEGTSHLTSPDDSSHFASSDGTSHLTSPDDSSHIASPDGCRLHEADVLPGPGEALVTPEYLRNMLRILKGDLPVQQTSTCYISNDIFQLEDGILTFPSPTTYRSSCETLHARGRCIGGCIDVLKDLIGTCFDYTSDFIHRYHEDGLIWYFDNFALSSAVLYRTLLQMRYAGWITPETTQAVLIGRTLFENEESDMTYDDAVCMAVPDIPVIWNMDIGHTAPHFSMINGAMLDVAWNGKTAQLWFELS